MKQAVHKLKRTFYGPNDIRMGAPFKIMCSDLEYYFEDAPYRLTKKWKTTTCKRCLKKLGVK